VIGRVPGLCARTRPNAQFICASYGQDLAISTRAISETVMIRHVFIKRNFRHGCRHKNSLCRNSSPPNKVFAWRLRSRCSDWPWWRLYHHRRPFKPMKPCLILGGGLPTTGMTARCSAASTTRKPLYHCGHAAPASGRSRWPCARTARWEVVSFPAIAEREETYEIETVLELCALSAPWVSFASRTGIAGNN